LPQVRRLLEKPGDEISQAIFPILNAATKRRKSLQGLRNRYCRSTAFEPWERELPRISGKSKLAEAIRYARSHRAALLLFLDDGRVEIDSNIVERAIRPQAIVRKNSLFAGSAGGGRTWASIATMLQTCKMNGVDPYAWAKLTLERIANRWPNSDIEALMPWNFKPIA
jgi:transposase